MNLASSGSRLTESSPPRHGLGRGSTLKRLVGAGDQIALFVAPAVVAGLVLNIVFPSAFAVGGPPPILRIGSIAVLIVGLVAWAWSVVLILTNVPGGKLITTGPYAIVRHPLYTAVALLVLPWLGFLLNSWLGLAIGIVLYIGSRRFAPLEEAELSKTFGNAWARYSNQVRIPWL